MILVLGFLVIGVLLLGVYIIDHGHDIAGSTGAAFILVGLLCAACVPIGRASDVGNIRYYEALRHEVNQIDWGIVDAAMRMKVSEENGNLARMQYWAKHPLTNWYHHPIVLQTKPIVIPNLKEKKNVR